MSLNRASDPLSPSGMANFPEVKDTFVADHMRGGHVTQIPKIIQTLEDLSLAPGCVFGCLEEMGTKLDSRGQLLPETPILLLLGCCLTGCAFPAPHA
ncbi:hypothetical protein chiPu_0018960 [Chiloscyllium punctatum]|uniref:Uncharacterized protein n=1 Tax=Chiloscyllium punctatum TaxID=137246 RepID=A0A401RQA6_CHIPU|nr:hypothetical protein [Chiloscyllium punctatum]